MKFSKIILGVTAAAAAVFCSVFTAFAEPSDFEPSVTRAIETNGSWGQSITFSNSDINPRGIGPDTTIEVEYELSGEPALPNQYQVELIFQNYDADPQIWAQVVPAEYDDTHAVFDYDAIVLAYGSDDFSTVNNICIGDRGVQMKVTYVKVTNYDPPVPETTVTEETTQESAEEASETEASASEATLATTEASADEPAETNNVVLFIIIIGAVVLVAAIVVIVVVSKANKKRFY